jgi:hypothetical protein
VLVIGLVLLLPVLYLAGIGPAARYTANQGGGDLPLVYRPVQRLCSAVPPAAVILRPYVQTWLPVGAYFDDDGAVIFLIYE